MTVRQLLRETRIVANLATLSHIWALEALVSCIKASKNLKEIILKG